MGCSLLFRIICGTELCKIIAKSPSLKSGKKWQQVNNTTASWIIVIYKDRGLSIFRVRGSSEISWRSRFFVQFSFPRSIFTGVSYLPCCFFDRTMTWQKKNQKFAKEPLFADVTIWNLQVMWTNEGLAIICCRTSYCLEYFQFIF